MDPSLAKQLFDRGGFLILLDMPEGSEFGIDYNSWSVGPKFKGVKMIPPGIHFIYFSAVSKEGSAAPRIGFFHEFKEHEVLVKRYDPQTEDIQMQEIPDEEQNRYRTNLVELDKFLGAYPYENYRVWFSLTNHISKTILDRLVPINGKITSQADLISMESSLNEAGEPGCSQKVDRQNPKRIRFSDEQGLPIMSERPGTEIRFTPIPRSRAAPGSGVIMIQFGMDATYALEEILKSYEKPEEILGEMQFAFVCFLIGQLYEAFEQWKQLVHLLSACNKAIAKYPELFQQFIMAMFYELKQCPEDFFVDIVAKSNFLTTTLSHFFFVVAENQEASKELKEKAAKFKAHLTKRFKWDFNLEPEEYRPTIA